MNNEGKKFSDKAFEKLRIIAEEKYSQFGEVNNPYLQGKVIFNAKGREHLKFKAKHRARSHQDQWIRFKLLKFAPEVIKLSRTLQGIAKAKSFELNRSNQRNEMILTDVIYYEFISVIDERIRVRVIIKKIGAAQPFFWSVIPFWKNNNKNEMEKLINYGNPEED